MRAALPAVYIEVLALPGARYHDAGMRCFFLAYLCYMSERPSGSWPVLYYDDFILAISLCMEVVLLGCRGRIDYAIGYGSLIF